MLMAQSILCAITNSLLTTSLFLQCVYNFFTFVYFNQLFSFSLVHKYIVISQIFKKDLNVNFVDLTLKLLRSQVYLSIYSGKSYNKIRFHAVVCAIYYIKPFIIPTLFSLFKTRQHYYNYAIMQFSLVNHIASEFFTRIFFFSFCPFLDEQYHLIIINVL